MFDVESVVNLLKKNNVEDICCIAIPDELNYANNMLIGTCQSLKHLNATYERLNKVYKRAREHDDVYIKGRASEESKWCAMDLGNMVVHLFTSECRSDYDLESLWTVGAAFDDQYQAFMQHQKDVSAQLDITDDDDELKINS